MRKNASPTLKALSATAKATGEERLEELEAENAVLEVKIEELEADIERLTKDKPIKVSSRS